MQAQAGIWLTSTQLSELAEINRRNAISAIEKGNWRNVSLITKDVQAKGGSAGVNKLVLVDSLPSELREKYYLTQTYLPEVATVSGQKEDIQAASHRKRMKIALWRFELIRHPLSFPRNSAERSEAIANIDGNTYTMPNGKPKRVTKDMLYRWLNEYENGTHSVNDLMPKERSDAGQKNEFIRAVDRLVKSGSITPQEHADIKETIERYVSSLWANGIDGWRSIQDYASERLNQMLSDIGINIDTDKKIVTRAYIERFRADFKIVDIHDNDAKYFFDKYIPRIIRHTNGMKPMELVVGDVHPIDIKCERPDGSEVYPRAIAWHDVGTGRVWFTVVFLTKGEGVRREHVAMSFAGMCDAWGLPERLYLDNGNEYKWTEMLDGFIQICELAHKFSVSLMETDRKLQTILRSRPYNAPAKAIEGLFSVIEQYLSQLPGWVGGNRQNQKTHNVGKAPAPFSGDHEEFLTCVDTGLERYHKRPQQAFDGRSPNMVMSDFVTKGWAKTTISREALLYSFAEEKEGVKIDRGYITFNRQKYYHDDLLPYSQRKAALVKVAKHDPSKAFIFFNGRELTCIADVAPTFGVLEGAGAKEQARRATVLRRVISARRKHCDRLDLVEEMANWNKTQPEALEAPVKRQVTLNKESPAAQIVSMMRQQKQQPPKKKKKIDLFLPDANNEYLDAVDWDDDEEQS